MRCLIVDDHPAVILALADVLADSGFEIVGTARRGDDAVERASALSPDCAVVDYRMPELGGAALIARLRDVVPRMALVVYTAEGGGAVAREALAAGADAVVLKEAPVGDVVLALEAALHGAPYVDPRFGHSPAAVTLSARETQVLTLIAQGHAYEEIAAELGIGMETCRTHLKKACVRLGAPTRSAAVARALRQGLIR